MYQYISRPPRARERAVRHGVPDAADCGPTIADWLRPAVRWTTGNPPTETLELPAALVRNRPASRRPRPRDAAAHRRADQAVPEAGGGGVRPRGRDAGHHHLHPAGHPDDEIGRASCRERV